MNAVIQSILHSNIAGTVIDVECTITNGLPNIVIVGLGNKSIDEAKERIRSAFGHTKLAFPKKRITINLAPADIPKDSSSFDVPIAVAILCTTTGYKQPSVPTAYIGELGLDGSVRSVRGIIGKLLGGKAQGITQFFIPKGNLRQASLVPGLTLFPATSLVEIHNHLSGRQPLNAVETKQTAARPAAIQDDFLIDDVVGQPQAKRALEIAAAGGHNIFLSGPPGTGKSMLARALPQLMPTLTVEEMLEVTHLHSLAANTYEELITQRPFRSPHHSASQTSIVGGGQIIRPGEISLSHHGVLLLDEMPEFARTTLESLRQPLESGTVTIARARESVSFPAHFTLIATANPCPCGYYDTDTACRCSATQVERYRQRISGPIIDRIDLFVYVTSVNHADLLHKNTNNDQPGKTILQKVIGARDTQYERFGNKTTLNCHMSNSEVLKFARLEPEAESLLNDAAAHLKLSARSYMRVIKLARTIADLEKTKTITTIHIGEALQYRPQNNGVAMQ